MPVSARRVELPIPGRAATAKKLSEAPGRIDGVTKPERSLDRFSPATRAWFEGVFAAPTPVQDAAWKAIGSGQHALVIAPTGSGKTLAAFLHAVDRLHRPEVRAEPRRGVRVLYVSPLKALAVDVQRNLRAPLHGIGLAGERLGEPMPDIAVAVRSGDTPADERRRLATHPPDILITTPESLFLMLSSQVGQILAGVDTVIIDEIHAVAGTKRGAHLMLSLERVEALCATPPQRIGLSATVRPAERVAAFLGGDRPVTIVNPGGPKTWDLSIDVPVEDLTELRVAADPDDPESRPTQSIWPFLENHLLDLVQSHRSTICFVNSRRVAERLTSHLNELHAERLGIAADAAGSAPPAQVMAQSGAAMPAPADVARAHHGSVSKERRAEIESALKAGTLPCVVATSSLELGIDMGAVDLVVQVQAPPSVASGLQRVGRAGHQVGAISKGVLLPSHRHDLVESAVVADRMRAGMIEEVRRLRNPLDVLAQQLVSMTLDTPATSAGLYELVRRSDPYRDLPRSAFDAVLSMLSGRYPSEEFAELRPRVTWDRLSDLVQARPGGRRLVTTSGGTIPDRGLFGVFIAGEGTDGRAGGRRVGELDEEMVYESRVGDTFTLGTTSWRIEDITPNQVLVTPAPGLVSRLPFWRGDSPSRPAELGTALGGFVRRLGDLDAGARDAELATLGLGPEAAVNLGRYLDDQREATGMVPDDTAILVERFRDELGDWRVLVHCSLGRAVLAPWALAVQRRARERYGVEAEATATNDGLILRLPDVDAAPPGADLVVIEADEIEQIVTDEVFGSALFASRFRECASRALLLPKRDPRRRSPLWQQRMRAAQLLSVAAEYPDFPIMLETMRECLEDVFDLPSLVSLLGDIAARRVRVVEIETPEASPFARSMLFGYIGEFVYDGDQPLAERRLAALSLDPALLAELLGRDGAESTLDPEVMAELEADLQFLSEPRRATTAEQLWDVIRLIGPLTPDECAERSADLEATTGWLADLVAQRRVAVTRVAGVEWVAVADDHGLLRDALGIPVPAGIVTGEAMPADDALNRLIDRWCRTHVLVTPGGLAARYGVDAERIQHRVDELTATGTLVDVSGSGGEPVRIHRDILDRLRRRTIARLRRQVEAVPQRQYATFLRAWHEIDDPGTGADALIAAVEQLAGARIPASMLESVVLPLRVRGYAPHLLDEAVMSGEVVWNGAGAIGLKDGWVQLWPGDAVLAETSEEPLSEAADLLWHRLAGGAAWRAADLAAEGLTQGEVTDALWELVWAGRVSADSFAPVRSLVTGGVLKKRPTARPTRRPSHRSIRLPTPPGGYGGRWSAVPRGLPAGDERRLASTQFLLGRYGVLTKGAVTAEGGSFAESYQVLSAMEEAGAVRRGYFVEGLGGAQFSLPGAVDRLRDAATDRQPVVVAACDPANPYGAALPWPETDGHRPSRKAGALVVLHEGLPAVYLERGVHTMVTFPGADLAAALGALADAVHDGRLATITIERINRSAALENRPLRPILEEAGFAMTPRGFRLRRRSAIRG